MSKNLTSGKPFPLITGFWGSVCVGAALMQIYSAVNGAITGHFLGVDALGGISSAGQIHGVICGFINGLTCGFAIPVSKAYGAGDWERVRRLLWWSILIGIGLSLTAALLVIPFGDSLLHVIRTPAENFNHASRYLAMVLLAMPSVVLFTLMYYMCHSMGDSRLAAVIQGAIAAIMVVFDVLFLVVLKMGAEGAALAILSAHLIGDTAALWYLLRKNPELRPRKGDFRFNKAMIRSLFSNGTSNAVSSTLMNGVGVFLQTAINSMGAVYVNAYAVANKLFGLLAFPISSLDCTMKAYLCQNAGAGKLNRLRQGYRCAMIMVVIYSVAFLAVVGLFTPQLVGFIVGDADGLTVALSRQYLVIIGFFSLVYGASTAYRHTAPALGYPGTIALTGALESAGRLIACVIVYRAGFIGVCLMIPLGWMARGAYDVAMSYVLLRKAEKRYAVKLRIEEN